MDSAGVSAAPTVLDRFFVLHVVGIIACHQVNDGFRSLVEIRGHRLAFRHAVSVRAGCNSPDLKLSHYRQASNLVYW